MTFKILPLLVLLSSGLQAFSQNGFIKGQVGDATTNELIPGVKITVDGLQKGAMTDLDGVFMLGNLAPGTYAITVTYPTYQTKKITDILVASNDTSIVRIALEKEVKEVGAVTVKGTVNKESNENIIKMQRNSATVVDGISQESIKKSPDSKASDVLKRVSGASVQDNKFVVVRGLSDRYNFALINGASLPSTESDRKAFSFDIFPSNMLDNLVIIKTATPELPGEFAGGVIDINTTESKAKNFHNIQIGGGFNTLTTFKNFSSSEGSGLDFLGLGAGGRAIPSDIPATETFASLTKDDKAILAEKMNFGWAAKNGKALPNGSLQYTLGRNIKIKEKSLGLVFAYSYQNNNSANLITRREFEEQSTGVILKMELEDSVFSKNIMNSAMLNLNFKFNDKNKISFKNMYSITSEDKVNIRRGVRELDNDPHQWERSTNIWYTQNSLYTSQLIGNHELKKGKFNWNTGFSTVQRDIPNLRRVVYRKYSLEEDDPNERYVAVVQNNGTIPTAAGNMFWSTSDERIVSAKYDYALPVNFGKLKNEFKIGGMHQYRDRDFVSRNFGFSQYKPTGSSFNSELLLLPEDQIFAPENLGLLDNGLGGFKLEEASSVDDSYQAEAFLNAGFLMIDSKIGEKEKIRIVGGARFESYNQRFQYVEFGSNLERNIDTTVNDILPSVNVIYAINNKMNLRASYYKTVSRPEFRELAPFAFYNFIQDNILSGNPNLQRALIDNFDVRFELFPGAGQVFSISGFYKSFTNPIELINRTGTSGAPELYYSNVPKVTNFGAELEYRLKLGFINKAKDSTFLDGTTFYTNLSLIRSRVDLSDFAGSGDERPLQGQSPYIVNAGLMYNSFKSDWSASISYNVVGQRIYIVGNIQEPSVWENGRHVVDIQISKIIKEKLEIKLNVKDILAQELTYFQDLNGNLKYDEGTDNNWQNITFGQTVSLSLKYNF
ncbi:MAG: TonB-dependent receptor domain-containing protein [Flavobacteriia bacterium]